jgi:signal transduction histidine kinase
VLKNAIQATEGRHAPEIKIEVSDNSHEAAISITDNGCGIEPELLDKIFIPKFTTKTSGMGLGLAIVKNIVEAHRGRIDLQSVKHKGTTIKITLPKNTEYNGTHKPDHSKV